MRDGGADDRVEALLAGPRGRRLLHEVLERRRLAARPDLAAVPDHRDVLEALADSVAWARYWQARTSAFVDPLGWRPA